MVSFVTVMDQTKVQQSKLFIYNVLEAKDDLDEVIIRFDTEVKRAPGYGSRHFAGLM